MTHLKNMESQNVEYKQNWHDDYLKTVAAFANTDGGTVFVGIDDNGKIRGVENAEKLIMELLVAKYLQKNFTYQGLQRIETLEYPEPALREAITNAVVHQNYNGYSFFTK